MSTTAVSSESARRELGAGFGGQVTARGDGGYDEARKLFNAMIDRKLALLAQCMSSDDVAHVIRFARTHDLPLAIRGGGHNDGGLGSVDDGVVADLSGLRSIAVDPDTRTQLIAGLFRPMGGAFLADRQPRDAVAGAVVSLQSSA